MTKKQDEPAVAVVGKHYRFHANPFPVGRSFTDVKGLVLRCDAVDQPWTAGFLKGKNPGGDHDCAWIAPHNLELVEDPAFEPDKWYVVPHHRQEETGIHASFHLSEPPFQPFKGSDVIYGDVPGRKSGYLRLDIGRSWYVDRNWCDEVRPPEQFTSQPLSGTVTATLPKPVEGQTFKFEVEEPTVVQVDGTTTKSDDDRITTLDGLTGARFTGRVIKLEPGTTDPVEAARELAEKELDAWHKEREEKMKPKFEPEQSWCFKHDWENVGFPVTIRPNKPDFVYAVFATNAILMIAGAIVTLLFGVISLKAPQVLMTAKVAGVGTLGFVALFLVSLFVDRQRFFANRICIKCGRHKLDKLRFEQKEEERRERDRHKHLLVQAKAAKKREAEEVRKAQRETTACLARECLASYIEQARKA